MQVADSLEKTLMLGKIKGRRREQQRMRYHQHNVYELGQTQGDGEGQGSLACCSPCACEESDMTWRQNNNKYPNRCGYLRSF